MSGEDKKDIIDDIDREYQDKLDENVKIEEPKEELVQKVSNRETSVAEKVEGIKDSASKKYSEYLETDNNLKEISTKFIKKENEITDTTVATTIELLKELNVDSLVDAKSIIAEIKEDNKEELMKIKTPSKGIAKGLLYAVLGAVATVAGASLYGSKISNLPLNVATFMQKTNLDTIALKYGELINIKESAIAGYALVGVAAFSVGAILYKVATWLQKGKNIRYAEKAEKDLEEYIFNIDNKVYDINELSRHIENIDSVMQKYDIILQEQNAKIRRMLFIEQPEDGVDSLQRASKLEIEKSKLILDELLDLMNTPVAAGVKINDNSRSSLESANSVINEVIKKLYI